MKLHGYVVIRSCHYSSLTNIICSRRSQSQRWGSPLEWLDSLESKGSRMPTRLNGQSKPRDSHPETIASQQHQHKVDSPSCGGLDGQLHTLCRNGQLDLAFHVLSRMDQLGTVPSHSVYVSLLKACCKRKALHHAKHVHAHLVHHKANIISLLGDRLVMTLAKCGGLEDACHVFHSLLHHTVFSWTALISCHVEYGKAHEALKLYQCMEGDGVEPNDYTFVSLLKACGSILDIEQGRKLHNDVRRMGLISNVYIVNTLVSMYGKCGNILEAENVFMSGVRQHDTVSWNVMLSAYIEQDEGNKALRLYRQMQEEGVSPDERTFVITLQACSNRKEHDEVIVEGQLAKVIPLEVGQALHADARRKGFSLHDFFVSTLVTMYGKCRSIAKAENVFCRLLCPDVVQWNAMHTAYAEHGHGNKVLQVHVQMQKEGISPDQHTFVIALQACNMLAEKEGVVFVERCLTKLMLLEIGEALRLDAWRHGFASNIYIRNTLINLYGKCGDIIKAEKLFRGMSDRRDVSWNAMLSAYVEQGEGEKALQLYSRMQKEDISPNGVTFVIALQACCTLAEKEVATLSKRQPTKLMSLEIGQALHADVWREGLAEDLVVGSTLVHMYGKCGIVSEAEIVFGGLSQRNVVSWNAMISAYVEQGQGDKASHLFNKMQEDGVALDDVTLVSVLQASSLTGWGETCRKAHFFLVSTGCDLSSLLATSLVHAYGSCALVADAQAVFNGLPQLDVVSWSAYIDAYAQEGNCVASLRTFKDMQWAGFKPDGVTFFSILSACSHAGLVDLGIKHFESMSKDCGLSPELKHYAIMMDLLGRAGDFARVEKMLERMPIQPDLAIWFSLLSVCRTHSNVEMGRRAFNHVVRLQPKEATAYVLMSNIYADAGMKDSANRVVIFGHREGLEEAWAKLDGV